MTAFYGDWIFYGGLFGAFGAGITIYFYAKKKGAENVTWKHCSVILLIYIFPTIMLPILLLPSIPLSEKIGVVVALTIFGAVRYYATTKGQEGVLEIRERKKKRLADSKAASDKKSNDENN